jgi:hypothetical protein
MSAFPFDCMFDKMELGVASQPFTLPFDELTESTLKSILCGSH